MSLYDEAHWVNLNPSQRSVLEAMADELEAYARGLDEIIIQVDRGNNPVSVRSKLFGLAWSIKQVARHGTPSEGL